MSSVLADPNEARRFTQLTKTQGMEILTGSDVVSMAEGEGGSVPRIEGLLFHS